MHDSIKINWINKLCYRVIQKRDWIKQLNMAMYFDRSFYANLIGSLHAYIAVNQFAKAQYKD